MGPSTDAELKTLFELDRRHRNVHALSAGVLVAALLMVLFVPVGWFFMREHFMLVQGGSTLWLASLLGTWVTIRKRPEWALEHSDALVFWLFLFVSMYSDFQVWIDTGYDSPYVLTLVFTLIGVNFFISWPAKRSATFGLAVYAVFMAPLLLGLVPVGDARTAFLYQAVLFGVALIIVGFQRHRFQLEFREFSSRMEVQSARRDLERAYEQLQELDQMKSEFFANVSHELRTPLTLILSPVDDLLEKLRPSAERDALKVVRRNATRLLRMIDDLLDLARLEAGGLRLRITQFDPCDLARRVAENAMPAARAKDIDLSFDANCEPAERYGDPHRIEIILTNLIGTR